MKKFVVLLVALFAAYSYRQSAERPRDVNVEPARLERAATDDPIGQAYASRQSGVQVAGRGVVSRVLGDDSLGDRHQRFIVTLESGQTVLIAHNIDLAPRVDSLREHEAGWIRHRGRTYQ